MSTGERQWSLARLIAPIDVETFVREHWERRPLRVAREDPTWHDGLLSLADLDAALCTLSIRAPDVRVLREGKHLPIEQLGEGATRAVGNLHEALYAQYRDGATIAIQMLQQRWPALAHLCRTLAVELSARLQVNVYLTPAGGTGLAVHYDTHDVFVLQTEGRKQWQLWEPVRERPNASMPFHPSAAPTTAPIEEFWLERGDTLYIPRGVPHRAQSADETSVHATVGVHPVYYDRLLSDTLLSLVQEDPRFREALPLGFAEHDEPNAAALIKLTELVEILRAHLDPELLLAEAEERAIAGRQAGLDGHLLDLEALRTLDIHTRVRLRPDLEARVGRDGDRLVLRFHGKELQLPDIVERELIYVCTVDSAFCAADIPGDLDDDNRKVLVARLLREGALTTSGA